MASYQIIEQHTRLRRLSRSVSVCGAIAMMMMLLFVLCGVRASAAPAIEFNRDIRPILADKCFRCHGPDAASREADLRLDTRAAALAPRGENPAIVPGRPRKSEVITRIMSAEASERMPPVDSGLVLSPKEISRLRDWISQGAGYQQHWSLITPVRPPLPPAAANPWCKNPIDAFVLARMNAAGLAPSARASKEKRLRRATLDLTGLPPALEELDALLADHSPASYRRAVDRLFSSPRYGEQKALAWLDAARYADTNGYFTDKERSMWRWREWVIDAFNRNTPFDQFTVEQLAGDLLPTPTKNQRIATGFHRNHMLNQESGIIEEEYRTEYVIDRVSTTATVWLGLTAGCARCHDHKYDPLSQKEFFQLFAFFNNLPERGLAGANGNEQPLLNIASLADQQQLKNAQQSAAAAQNAWTLIEPEVSQARAAWERTAIKQLPAEPIKGLVAHYRLDGKSADSNHPLQPQGAIGFTAGLRNSAAKFDGDSLLEASAISDFNSPEFDSNHAFSYGAWVYLQGGHPMCIISKNDDANSLRGFDVLVRKGKVAVHLVHRWNTDAIQVISQESVGLRQWRHVMVTYDGSRKAAGVKVYLDGRSVALDIKYDRLRGSLRTNQPLRIGRRSTSAPFVGLIDEVRIYNRRLSSVEVERLASRELVLGVLQRPAEQRPPALRRKLESHYMARHAQQSWRTAWQQLQQKKSAAAAMAASLPTTMVMQERAERRPTFLLERGQYDQPGEEVKAGVPASLPPLPQGAVANRLGLARWIVSPNHPLTARVAVNRMWRRFFGEGIVATVEDFGAQGEWPSHPQLLDWLAVEFMESGWDIKHVERLIVNSAAYQQASAFTPALLAKDPKNRLLARGPRFRLAAETLRDTQLAIGGLLVEKTGGPSVKPHQPPGLWKAVTYDGALEYQQDLGADSYRRGLYTFWKRQSPPPSLLAFDAPTRETCTPRRSRTNTPLQALVLMNDRTSLEAACALAQRMLHQGRENSPAQLIVFAFRLATARTPAQQETNALEQLYQTQLAEFEKNPKGARQLLDVGGLANPRQKEIAPLAAWATIANVILCLDETLTKN